MRYTETRSIAMGQLPKNERGAEPIPGSPISQEEDKVKTKHKKVCVFIKLHITAQSGPVILVILCHSH